MNNNAGKRIKEVMDEMSANGHGCILCNKKTSSVNTFIPSDEYKHEYKYSAYFMKLCGTCHQNNTVTELEDYIKQKQDSTELQYLGKV